MEDPRIISALFISLKMAYYNVLINIIKQKRFLLSYIDFICLFHLFISFRISYSIIFYIILLKK